MFGIFWSDSKGFFSRSWATRTYYLPCDFPVFISKISECKQVELFDDFRATFAEFLVTINDTVQLYLQLSLVFIATTSLSLFPNHS